MIQFTQREILRAWRENRKAYQNAKEPKLNAHRLLLFYAVECGLKAVLMKRKNKYLSDNEISSFGHDLRALLSELHVNTQKLQLSGKLFNKECSIYLKPILKQRSKDEPKRVCRSEEINQIWRYGHQFEPHSNIQDQELELELNRIASWIEEVI